jgi:hypothetical protein
MLQEYDPCVNHDHTVPPFWRNMLLPFLGYESCCAGWGSSRFRDRSTETGAAS